MSSEPESQPWYRTALDAVIGAILGCALGAVPYFFAANPAGWLVTACLIVGALGGVGLSLRIPRFAGVLWDGLLWLLWLS